MKAKKFLLLITAFGIIFSCQKTNKIDTSNFQSEKIQLFQVEKDTTQSYYIFIPQQPQAILIGLDAHKDGKKFVKTFKNSAEKLGFIVIGSNNFENNTPNAQSIVNNIVEDIRQKLKLEQDIPFYIGGFSGGGRYAQYLAFSSDFYKGCISLSAGFFPQQNFLNKVPLAITIGTQDFNYREGIASLKYTYNYQIPAVVLFFKGKHEYPDEQTVFEALSFVYLNSLKNKTLAKDKEKINLIKKYFENKCDTNDLQAKYVICNLAINYLEDFTNTKKFQKQIDKIKDEPQIKKYAKKQQKINQLESYLEKNYYTALQEKSLGWWKNELKILQEKIETEKDSDYKDMYLRIKNFLGIVCYQKSKEYAMKRDLENLKKIIFIYQTLEPENADMMFFKSYLFQLEDNQDSAKFYLNKAIENGFDTTAVLYKNLKK